MGKFVVILALITACVLGELIEHVGPKGHGMGPSVSRIPSSVNHLLGASALDVCSTLRSTYHIDPKVECEVTEQEEDDLTVTSRVVQRINGYKVLSSDVRVNVVKASGDIIVSGQFYVQPPVHTKLLVTPVRAVKVARKALAIRLADRYTTMNPNTMIHNVEESEMVYAAPHHGLHIENMRLCYKVNLMAPEERHHAAVLVDAETEDIIDYRDYKYDADVAGKTETAEYGRVDITVSSYSLGGYQAAQTQNRWINHQDCGTLNYNTCFQQTSRASRVTNSDRNSFGDKDSYDPYRMSPYYCAEKVWDYYVDIFGRASFDGRGSENQFYGIQNAVNAFWVTYNGHGEAFFDYTPNVNLVCCDVVGHEMTHGVTGATAGLIYQNESGALNEGFSDIMGVYFNQKLIGDENQWVVGYCTSFLQRDIADPKSQNYPATYKGSFWVTGTSDNGGVHTNSQVLTHIFYMMCVGEIGTNDNGDRYSVTGMGRDKAAAISYRALTHYLTASSDYADARQGFINAANELYGSNEANIVKDAFFAGGVGSAASASQ